MNIFSEKQKAQIYAMLDRELNSLRQIKDTGFLGTSLFKTSQDIIDQAKERTGIYRKLKDALSRRNETEFLIFVFSDIAYFDAKNSTGLEKNLQEVLKTLNEIKIIFLSIEPTPENHKNFLNLLKSLSFFKANVSSSKTPSAEIGSIIRAHESLKTALTSMENSIIEKLIQGSYTKGPSFMSFNLRALNRIFTSDEFFSDLENPVAQANFKRTLNNLIDQLAAQKEKMEAPRRVLLANKDRITSELNMLNELIGQYERELIPALKEAEAKAISLTPALTTMRALIAHYRDQEENAFFEEKIPHEEDPADSGYRGKIFIWYETKKHPDLNARAAAGLERLKKQTEHDIEEDRILRAENPELLRNLQVLRAQCAGYPHKIIEANKLEKTLSDPRYRYIDPISTETSPADLKALLAAKLLMVTEKTADTETTATVAAPGVHA